MKPVVLEISGVTKSFGPNKVNDDISIALGQGEIVALLGENGAGKTTLMNILFGHYVADAGRVAVMGAPLPPGQPRAAIRAGIGMVHQHFSLAGNLTVMENVLTGAESLWSLRSRGKAARAKLARISERFGLPIDPDARVADLSVGERQRVEILKPLYNDARILVLDEPTAVLSAQEAERLFATLRGMAGGGLSLLFISHKLDEVMRAADRILVLRGGRLVAERRPAETSKAELAELMVGRAVARPRREPAAVGPAALQAIGVTVRIDGVERLKAADLTARCGEILGIVGVSGMGQAFLQQVITGLRRPTSGDLLVDGRPVARWSPAAAIAAGVGRIPEDRNHDGVIGEMTIAENVILERLPRFSRRGLVDRRKAAAFAQAIIERFDVRGGVPSSRARTLSGGNMQKLILGRNLIDSPRILVASQPTRGLDEGAVAAVHGHILAARRRGAAVLIISEDLDEIMALADRVQAIVGGRLSPPADTDALDAQKLGLLIAGVWDAPAPLPQ